MNVPSVGDAGNRSVRLDYYRREKLFGQLIAFRVATADHATGLLTEYVGEQLQLEPVSGALLPASSPQVQLPPSLLAALVRRGVLVPVDEFDGYAFESWLDRRRRYVPETDSAVHRARAAGRVAHALDALVVEGPPRRRAHTSRPRGARAGGPR